jgi:hypothetical protein
MSQIALSHRWVEKDIVMYAWSRMAPRMTLIGQRRQPMETIGADQCVA